MPAHFTPPHSDHAGEFRSTLIAGNNEIVSASEGYVDIDDAGRWPDDMLRWVVEAREPKVRDVLNACLVGAMSSGAQRTLVIDSIIASLTTPFE